jgi:hypothetical protein
MAHTVLVGAILHVERGDLVGWNVAALVKPPKGQLGGRPSKSLTLKQTVLRYLGAGRPMLEPARLGFPLPATADRRQCRWWEITGGQRLG